MLYADVILPLPLNETYTYSVPADAPDVKEGCRVLVQFGKKKFYTAIILRLFQDNEKPEIKSIISVLDDFPIVTSEQLRFWQWISFYYMCSLGDVYKAALPSALKLESETFVLRSDVEGTFNLTPTESRIFYLLSETQPLRISEIEKQSHINNVIPYIKSLVDKKAAVITENIKNTYRAKTEKAVRLAKQYSDRDLHLLLDSLQRAKKQYHLLSCFLLLRENVTEKASFSIGKKELLGNSGVSSAVLEGLVERGIFEVFSYQVSRFDYKKSEQYISKQLNLYQEKAFQQVKKSFSEKEVVLLHGVTSSGKTEIYIKLIEECLSEGKQVLYLLPEIALTTQITERIQAVFGDKLAVYHSRFNDNERAEVWTDLLHGKVQVILGARSSIFLPFSNLGIIVVDEEHESSYKQQDPAPRYNARNAAIVLANYFKAKVLLGTATPSIETYYNALSGRYGLVTLSRRHEDIELPDIVPVNTKELKRKRIMKSIFSPLLIEQVNKAMEKSEQAILFQNRRGFAPLLECKVCAWTPVCDHCDVSLTYHKGQHAMICHYCGSTYHVPHVCPACEEETLENIGYGTERVEEEVNTVFPDASVLRMDMDTTRGKHSYEKIISAFENNKANILVGTQMVSKGLDFENVSIVGILNADNALNFPDFRAHEKAFQLLMQVSGRAGRKNKRGLVVLQTSQPNHPVINSMLENDYRGFYETQIKERELFSYPPYFRLISIVMKGKDEFVLENASVRFVSFLQQTFQDRVLGPAKPPVSRIQSVYIRKILLKIENTASPQKVREVIKYYKDCLSAIPEFRSILIYFDVDPMI